MSGWLSRTRSTTPRRCARRSRVAAHEQVGSDRSTMLRSSSTTQDHGRVVHHDPGPSAESPRDPVDVLRRRPRGRFDGEAHHDRRARRHRLERDRPPVGLDDAPRRWPGPGPHRGRRSRPARGAGRPARPAATGMPAPSSATRTVTVWPRRRAADDTSTPVAPDGVADGVLEEVDEHLLQPVVVGPDRRQVGRTSPSVRTEGGASVTHAPRRLQHQTEVAPVAAAGAGSRSRWR